MQLLTTWLARALTEKVSAQRMKDEESKPAQDRVLTLAAEPKLSGERKPINQMRQQKMQCMTSRILAN